MKITEEFKVLWKKNNSKHGIDEKFPTFVVDVANQIKHFMKPENRKYQGAVGNSRGMIDAVEQYCKTASINNSVKFFENVRLIFDYLLKVRLTSQVPLNTIFFIMRKLKNMDPETTSMGDLQQALLLECDFHRKNYKLVRKQIANNMASRIIDRCEEYDQDSIIIGTHCHSGAVIGALVKSKEYIKEVVVTKTEPEQQGVLTAKELADEGIKVKFITLAQYGVEFRRVNMFCFGIDAVSVEGIVLNKSGTRMIATLAHTKELPVYFLGSTYKYARNTLFGGLIRVERRDVTNHMLFNHLGVDLHKYVLENKISTRFFAFDTTKPEFYNSTVSEVGFLPMREAFHEAWKPYL
ncbi:hypothetical protein GF325_18740 [Candidatus Bathyarchaeota archaeon]|nr:hypothetical protein [Candidatus Bathyarchaeota archaeon]